MNEDSDNNKKIADKNLNTNFAAAFMGNCYNEQIISCKGILFTE
jgi:hypothetical protein